MPLVLREYQEKVLAEASAGWRAGKRRMLIQLPTGSGKGRIIARSAALAHARGKRVTLMAHRVELVTQISRNLRDEGIEHGLIMPSQPMNYLPIQVGMVQTIARRLDVLQQPDLITTDECHHMPAGQYVAISERWLDARHLGVTATPIRMDGRGLIEHFDALVCGPSVRELIDGGFLADYDYFLPSDVSMHGVRTERGDYVQADALQVMERAHIVGDAVEHYRRYLGGRPAIAFCYGVQHCVAVAEQFAAAGFRAAHVDGKMDLALRAERIAALGSGGLDVLTAADVVSEGTDIPAVAGAILLRPTKSLSLHLQQIGRSLRPKPDGSRAIILDHVGNASRHGLPADPRTWTLESQAKKPAPKLRECETCFRVFRLATARETAAAECRTQPCPITAPGVSAEAGLWSSGLEILDGELTRASDPWAWTGGIDVARAAGAEWQALLAKADTESRLKQVATARGYRRGWVQHIIRSRAAYQQAAAE